MYAGPRDGAPCHPDPGDGTGPELTEATRRVLEATGVGFDWDVRQAIVRENTEDLYAGIEYEAGTPEGERVFANIGPDVAVFEATHGSAPKYKGQNHLGMKPSRDDSTAVGTSEYADAIIDKLEAEL